MFLPRALQLRQQAAGSGGGPAATSMAKPNVAPLLVAYLRKRGLAKTLKAFVAETSFKDAGEPVPEDLEAIYGSYLLTKGGSKKRKTQNGAAETLGKKTKLAAASKVQPVAASSSPFEDSESGSEEEESSSYSDESEDEEVAPRQLPTESKVQPRKKILPSAPEKKSPVVSTKTPKKPAGKPPVAVKISLPVASNVRPVLSSSDDSDSSSEEKEGEPVKAPVAKTPVNFRPVLSSSDDSDSSSEEKEGEPVKAPVAKTPVNVRPVLSSSDDSDSSSEEKEGEPVKAPVAKTPVRKLRTPSKKVAAKLTHGASIRSSASSFSDYSAYSDYSDWTPEELKSKKIIVKAAPQKNVGSKAIDSEKAAPSSSSDESVWSSEGENTPAVKDTAKKNPPEKKVVMKKADNKSNAAESSSSDDESDSSSEDEAKAAEIVAKVLGKVGQKTVHNDSKRASKILSKKTQVTVASKVESSSSEESEDEEAVAEPPVKKQAALPVARRPNKASRPATETSERKRKREADKPSELVKIEDTRNGSTDGVKGTPKIENKNGATAKRQKLSQVPANEGMPKFFQKIKVSEVKYADPRLQDNSYWAKNGAEEGWGAKAQEILGQVKGKGFRHEKTKKKRGSYKGGIIDFSSHSIKFRYSDEE